MAPWIHPSFCDHHCLTRHTKNPHTYPIEICVHLNIINFTFPSVRTNYCNLASSVQHPPDQVAWNQLPSWVGNCQELAQDARMGSHMSYAQVFCTLYL